MKTHERCIYEQQIKSLEDNLWKMVQGIIGEELRGIGEIADRISGKEGERLKKRVERIEERINLSTIEEARRYT